MRRLAAWEGAPRAAPFAVLVAAVTVAAAVGLLPRWPGLVHLVALPPLDQSADLRALLTRSTSAPVFAAALVVVTGVRIGVLALVLGGLDRARVGRAARYYLTVLPFSAIAAAVTFAASASLFYLLFWVGFALTLVVVAVAAAAPWCAEGPLRDGYRAAARHGFRLGTVGAYLAVLALLGALADVGGERATVALVPVSGLLTLATARALVADPGLAWARRAAAAVPLAGLLALLGVAATGPAAPPTSDAPDDPRRDSLLFLMSGVDSRSGSGAILEIDPAVMGWDCDGTRYVSYAGAGDGQPQGDAQCPSTTGAPYEETDTLRPTDELVDALAAQLEGAGSAVLAAHSQGVWISWAAAAEGRLPDLDHLVLVGAFPQNPAPYQLAGPGPGALGAPVLDVVVGLGRPGGTSVFEPDSPLGREWLAHPDAIEDTLARPLPDGIEALSITSVFDHPLMPGGWRIAGAADACPVPVVHPNLPFAEELQEAIVRFVDGDELPACPAWRRSIGPLFRPFAAMSG